MRGPVFVRGQLSEQVVTVRRGAGGACSLGSCCGGKILSLGPVGLGTHAHSTMWLGHVDWPPGPPAARVGGEEAATALWFLLLHVQDCGWVVGSWIPELVPGPGRPTFLLLRPPVVALEVSFPFLVPSHPCA